MQYCRNFYWRWVRFFNFVEEALLKRLFRWVRTGDKVVIDENNDMFIVDRLKVALLRFPLVHAKGVAVYVGNFEGPRISSRPC